MENLSAEWKDGMIVIQGFQDGEKLYKVPCDQYKDLYSLISHKKDFSNALEILEQWGENEIINKALLIAALTQFLKCFQICADRMALDETMFDSKEDAKEAYNEWKSIRNKYIIHDDSAFDQSIIGIVVDSSEKKVVDWVANNFSANIFDHKYGEALYNIIAYAQKQLENMIDEKAKSMIDDYRKRPWEEIEKMETPIYTVPDHL